jgi:2-isopropylmalate synthase
MGLKALPEGKLAELTGAAKIVAEIANIPLDPSLPYVGQNAFAHKAGMHIDAVIKNPAAYEHVQPESVGNTRVFLMSEVAGRSTIIEKIKKFDPSIEKNSETAGEIVQKMKDMEHAGYQFEGADGSFELLVRKTIGKYRSFFKLHYYKILGEKPRFDEALCSFAQIKIEVDGQLEVTAGEGDGPVHALDTALRKALERFYPSVSGIRLIDYKVRVLDASTAARVRVLIESTDGLDTWTTVGVSADIVEASWFALVDSFEFKLIKDVEKKFRGLL